LRTRAAILVTDLVGDFQIRRRTAGWPLRAVLFWRPGHSRGERFCGSGRDGWREHVPARGLVCRHPPGRGYRKTLNAARNLLSCAVRGADPATAMGVLTWPARSLSHKMLRKKLLLKRPGRPRWHGTPSPSIKLGMGWAAVQFGTRILVLAPTIRRRMSKSPGPCWREHRRHPLQDRILPPPKPETASPASQGQQGVPQIRAVRMSAHLGVGGSFDV